MLRFPWKQNQRLSCACLSVFLVIGHLSLFLFWTTSYLLTYLCTLQCASDWMSRWCCIVPEAEVEEFWHTVYGCIFIFSFFVSLFFSVISLPLLYSYSEVMCTQYAMYSLCLLPSSGSVSLCFAVSCLFLFRRCSSSLVALWCQM